MIPLGPFELIEPAGRGGMAEVWRGVHREERVPVAVKVLTKEDARAGAFGQLFRNEVRAVAGLDHPHVVLVFDHGEVPEEAERLSGGRLAAGSPYLVMEWASGGTLAGREAARSWPALRAALAHLLDALAHAHAREVIHRDLKPSNVLACTPDDLRPGLKLADFGIAEPRGGAGEDASAVVGTPAYMSPEQAVGDLGALGPWTDLYALGCLVHKLATGIPPFGRRSRAATLRAQLQETPPKLMPSFPVPPGLDGWLERLLAKAPERRFQRAADAAHGLAALGDAPGADELPSEDVAFWPLHRDEPSEGSRAPLSTPYASGSAEPYGSGMAEPGPAGTPPVATDDATDPGEPAAGGPEAATEASLPATPRHRTPPGIVTAGGAAPDPAAPAPADEWDAWSSVTEVDPRRQPARAPLPQSWRGPRVPPPRQLVGAGLGLYGLRAIPLVDREPERDALWETLHEVDRTGEARLVLLQGAAGCGKSRLAEWLAERAHEVGAVTPLRAVHGPALGPHDGIGPMLARHLRCAALGRDLVAARVRDVLRREGIIDPDEADVLVELIAPDAGGGTDGARPVRFRGPVERWEIALRAVRRLALERPVLVWIDDAHWAPDAIGFASHVLDAQAQEPCPVLLVLTAREEVLAERPLEAGLLRDLGGRPRVRALPVGPLAPEFRPALVRELLGLEGDLAAQVEARTAGNPLFAVQLVGDWVERGILEPGRAGFRLRAGARADLPEDLHQVWTARVERVLAGRADAEAEAIELAAALGQDVDGLEWRDTCAAAGLPVPLALVEVLLGHRLARCGPGGPREGWAFVHGMLRESLERRAREAGRLETHHHACALMLRARKGPGLAERLGRHLLAAGETAGAIAPLLEGARQRITMGDYRVAEPLLVQWDTAMAAVGVRDEDERWGQGWLAWCRLRRFQGAYEEALTWAERAEEEARRHSWHWLMPSALAELGDLARMLGNRDRARAALDAAIAGARALGDRRTVGASVQRLGLLVLEEGKLDEARACGEEALAHAEACGDVVGATAALFGLSHVAQVQGRLGEAAAWALDARRRFEDAGVRWGVADAVNILGEIARLRGDHAQAVGHYREAVRRYRAIGAGGTVVAQVNLGLTLIEAGRHAEAAPFLREGLAAFELRGRRPWIGVVHTFLLACAAAARDWAAFDRHAAAAGALLDETRYVELDVARMARHAGDLAREAGEPARAARAWALAHWQWTALGRANEAQAVEALLRES